ncbi:MAG TPA: hypothetical protein DEV81_23040 [Cyanobacteria bacterium UBA11049]|nr:hypothetical protein [Cyanobacteria bacterium UBA11049]
MFSNLSRRQLLRLIGFLIAGTAAVGSIPFLGKFFVSKAQAQTVNELLYKNQLIRIVPKLLDDIPDLLQTRYTAPVELFIDDRRVNVIQITSTNKYRTYLLPFTDYDSVIDLAKALIDARVALPNDPATSQVPVRDLQLNNPGY